MDAVRRMTGDSLEARERRPAVELETIRLGLVGAGEMAEALIAGLVGSGRLEPGRILVNNRSNRARLEHLRSRWGVRTTQEKAALAEAEVLVLAVKPADAAEALAQLRPHVRDGAALVSVVAGLRTEAVLARLGRDLPVVRAMPNTPSRVGEGATALAAGRLAGERELALARQLFAGVGRVVEVEEGALDAVTGLSGSGPAYVFLLLEALIDAGVKQGLEYAVARELALQTVFGAAKMARERGEDPARLREEVTSPNGTTVAGLAALEQGGFRQALEAAVGRATARARELGLLYS
ncbi:MAG: pyrroline-5-carboxylate reductase [Bacillota bacterium]|nr:pyrroline-5-carboxylate reductase [Bacillota bacterium]